MKLLDLYYAVKPAIPHEIRLRLRSSIAARQRRRSADVWPIKEEAGRYRPDWWSGWPHGKKCAFVLTHDVEGKRGLNRCRMLAELEMSLGFRSSFNFVPEGAYDVSESLRVFLDENCFEIGVHDLHHDGTLYRSKSKFSASAGRINDYLRKWNAVGFRSAFMFHNLEWLKELDVLYDASTFDIDPFEPQPHGANTIFPFWVPRSDGTGYVELPYTLAQDSTLFLVLGERTNEVWKRKLDWIVENGGMALVNVHPDYLAFGGGNGGRTEFSADTYAEFLSYASTSLGRDAWFALPREVATFVKQAVLQETDQSSVAKMRAEDVL